MAYTPPPFPIQTPVEASFRFTPKPVPKVYDPGPATARAWQQGATIVQNLGNIGAKAFQEYQKIKDVEKKKQVAFAGFKDIFGNEDQYPVISKKVNSQEFEEKAMAMTSTQLEKAIAHFVTTTRYYEQMKAGHPEEGKIVKIVNPVFSPYADSFKDTSVISGLFKKAEGELETRKKEFKVAGQEDFIRGVNQQLSDIAANRDKYPNRQAMQDAISQIPGLATVRGDKNIDKLIGDIMGPDPKQPSINLSYLMGSKRPLDPSVFPKGELSPELLTAENKSITKNIERLISTDLSLQQKAQMVRKDKGIYGKAADIPFTADENEINTALKNVQKTLADKKKTNLKKIKLYNSESVKRNTSGPALFREISNRIDQEEAEKKGGFSQDPSGPLAGFGLPRPSDDFGPPTPIMPPPPVAPTAIDTSTQLAATPIKFGF